MTSPQTFLRYAEDPDTFYSSYYDAITFIYDPVNNKLYSAPYPKTHQDVRQSKPELRRIYNNETSIERGLILGRLAHEESKDLRIIAFWNVSFQGTELADCLNAVIKQYPEYGSPDTIVMSDKRGIYDDKPRNFNSATLGEIPGVRLSKATQKQGRAPTQDKPECAVTLDVLGQPTSLDTIMGNFHMVKDNRLPAMKTAICSQGVQMRGDLEKAGCDVQVSMLDDLVKKADCQSSGQEYNKLKAAGRIDRKQYLRGLFGNPERMDREFRTQKDIDDAWDELQGKKEHRMLGFAEWLAKYS